MRTRNEKGGEWLESTFPFVGTSLILFTIGSFPKRSLQSKKMEFRSIQTKGRRHLRTQVDIPQIEGPSLLISTHADLPDIVVKSRSSIQARDASTPLRVLIVFHFADIAVHLLTPLRFTSYTCGRVQDIQHQSKMGGVRSVLPPGIG